VDIERRQSLSATQPACAAISSKYSISSRPAER
jgi:hypothetical protein